ncbi:MAG: hypothetical protein IJJ32_02030 [Eggerthellaceae bacterium]|nr:hypothetical protein [Eggerthellaceae bacterium]
MKRIAALLIASMLVFGALFAISGCSSSSSNVKVENGIAAHGTYSVAVTLEGGTGKATIKSPVKLKSENGTMVATVVWSSSSYDLMIVDGKELKPTTTDGGSTFEVPISALDTPIAVQAETTAMSQPHLIDYKLTFDSKSLKAA